VTGNSTTSLSESRIEILDGFRCIAVMAVVLYHYFYSLGPIVSAADYPHWVILRHGYFGVQLFFMISGFVIYRSMEQSNSIKDFLGKRYFRLVPALALSSIVTYVMIEWWNDSERIMEFAAGTPLSLLFSFTLIHPDIWNILLGQDNIQYVDGAYWSLWSEVLFYISASVLFFNSGRNNFLRNWFILVLIVNVIRIVTSPKLMGYTPDFLLPVSQAYYRSFFF
jgi:peptidoglycan/LPS O-acetylase OafA/YrhL